MSQDSNASGLPIEQIRFMRSQGLDNNQIIESLQRDGFSSSQIFDAMNSVDMPSGGFSGAQSVPPRPRPSPQPSSFPSSQSSESDDDSLESFSKGEYSTEELIESIIDEKWNDLVKEVQKVVDWKTQVSDSIVSLQQQLNDMRREFDKLHSSVISRVEKYDQNISNVGAEVKAMEKVFTKVLPVFTENVSALGTLVKEFKQSKVSDSQSSSSSLSNSKSR